MAWHIGTADSQIPALFRLGLLELGKRESFTPSRAEKRQGARAKCYSFESSHDLFQKKKGRIMAALMALHA
jgi:hypothetical protein